MSNMLRLQRDAKHNNLNIFFLLLKHREANAAPNGKEKKKGNENVRPTENCRLHE